MKAKTLLVAAALAAMLPFSTLAQQPAPGSATILEGTIRTAYKEPGTIQIVTADKSRWTVILAPMFYLTARGATPDMFKVGTPVRVEGSPTPDKKMELKASKITLDGSNSFLMS